MTGGRVVTGDCLAVLPGLDAASVDLIYLDPPFNSGKVHTAAAGAFADRWQLDAAAREWHAEVAGAALHAAIRAGHMCHGPAMAAYLIFMARRLLECHRVLAPRGTLYLHCDQSAAAYLEATLDAVFGPGRHRNSIIWHYRRWTTRSSNFQRMHDVILRYSRGDDPKWTVLHERPSAAKARHLEQGYQFNKIKGKRYLIAYDPDKAAAVDRASYDIARDVSGADPGIALNDVWHDIQYLSSSSGERLGWPTQKPLPLVERIILASTDPGDTVLDPMCGSGTALLAAKRLGRRWIGIDAQATATALAEERLASLLI